MRLAPVSVCLLVTAGHAAAAPPSVLLRAARDYALHSPVDVVAGDFNQDGRPDLAVTNLYDDSVSVMSAPDRSGPSP